MALTISKNILDTFLSYKNDHFFFYYVMKIGEIIKMYYTSILFTFNKYSY